MGRGGSVTSQKSTKRLNQAKLMPLLVKKHANLLENDTKIKVERMQSGKVNLYNPEQNFDIEIKQVNVTPNIKGEYYSPMCFSLNLPENKSQDNKEKVINPSNTSIIDETKAIYCSGEDIDKNFIKYSNHSRKSAKHLKFPS